MNFRDIPVILTINKAKIAKMDCCHASLAAIKLEKRMFRPVHPTVSLKVQWGHYMPAFVGCHLCEDIT